MSLIETEELVKKIAGAISRYRVHSSMIMERQLNYDKEIEALTTMMSCVVQMPTVDAIPIEWLEEKLTGHPELPYAITDGITNVLDLWKAEQVEQ